MNTQDIEALTKWDNYGMGHLRLHVDLFGHELAFVLFPSNGAAPVVTTKMTAIVNDVLALPYSDLAVIKDMLWEEANFAFTVSDYGVEPQDDETHLQAHMRDFGITGPDDTYAASIVSEVHVVDDHDARFARLVVQTATANTVNIIVMNGRIIDWAEESPYLPAFETDAQASKKQRAEILGKAGVMWSGNSLVSRA